MAFALIDKQLDTLEIKGEFPANQTTTLSGVTILNNEALVLDVSGIVVPPTLTNLTNKDKVTILRLIIDWGDGTENHSISPIVIPKMVEDWEQKLEDYDIEDLVNAEPEWSTITHIFRIYEMQPTITVKFTVWNTLGDCAIILLPVTIIYKSFLELEGKWRMVSANITNDNDVSYVFNETLSRNTIVVKSIKDYHLH